MVDCSGSWFVNGPVDQSVGGSLLLTDLLMFILICCQIFENRGSVMGCSNPHPHCQVSKRADFVFKRADFVSM